MTHPEPVHYPTRPLSSPSSGLVFEELPVPARPTTPSGVSPETSERVMTQMGLGVIGVTVGIAASALLLIAYTTLVPPVVDRPEEVRTAQPHNGLKVRKGLSDAAQDQPVTGAKGTATRP